MNVNIPIHSSIHPSIHPSFLTDSWTSHRIRRQPPSWGCPFQLLVPVILFFWTWPILHDQRQGKEPRLGGSWRALSSGSALFWYNRSSYTNSPSTLPLHSPLTLEQDPEICKFLHLGKDSFCILKVLSVKISSSIAVPLFKMCVVFAALCNRFQTF